MGRYNKILDGASINDLDEGGAYNYYGYSRSEGSWVIMRMNSAETEIRYAVGGEDYETAWTNRATKIYARAEAFKY